MHPLLQFDQEVFRSVHQGMHSAPLDVMFLVLSYSGLGQVQFLASFLLLKWEETKRYVVPLLVVTPFSGWILADITKKLVQRDRPSNMAWVIPQEGHLANSFPSGHTTTSFAVATLLVLMTWRTPHFRWAKWFPLWAFLVGVSRMYRGVHWPTDVLGGACFGVLGGAIVYLWLGRRGQTSAEPSA